MATVYFSVAGEGRGHATRVRAIVELLRNEHRFLLFASGAAYELLAKAYAETSLNVAVYRIPGLGFRYSGQRLNYTKTLLCELPSYLWGLGRHVSTLEAMMHRDRPDLAISDFEPILPRAANRCQVPLLSIDHQHFLVVNDLSSLPSPLQWKAWMIGLSVGGFCRGQRKTVVSSFFSPPLRRGCEDVLQVGVLLRPEILRARSTVSQHLVVYLQRFAQENVLQALEECGRTVRVYGLGQRSARGRLEFLEVSEEGFLDDLAGADALITNGGNQVIGEAHFLRKPVLALPESGNFEQAINAHFLRESGGGDSIACDELTTAGLRRFLDQVPQFRQRIDPQAVNGNQAVLKTILEHLPAAGPVCSAAAVKVA